MFKIKKDVHNLAELQRRKAELKAQIDRETEALKATAALLREDLKPGNLLRTAVRSFFSLEPAKDDLNELNEKAGKLRGPLQLITDILVPDRRLAFLLKNIAPFLLAMAPQLLQKAGKAMPSGKRFYGALRKQVAALRGRMKREEKKQDETPEVINP